MTENFALAPAARSDLDFLWPAVEAAHIFPDRSAFVRFHAREPWRVLLGPRGSAAVVERWREHLDILAIRGVWASARELPGTLAELHALAANHGFSQLLSPLVSAEAKRVYERAGMLTVERLVAYRASEKAVSSMSFGIPAGVTVRDCVEADVAAIDAIDQACFDSFWAYGEARLAEALALGQLMAAESERQVIGYTLSTVERGSGTLGRIAVLPAHRGRGMGAALLQRSAEAMVASGAGSVSLCTQQGNAAARALYARSGMREVPGKLLFLIGDAVRSEGRP